MPLIEGILALLDSRSFGSVWFWMALLMIWALNARRLLGVPVDVVLSAGKGESQGLLLLDWLSLSLPRWQPGQAELAVIIAAVTFIFSSLLLLGFVYGLEMAQALVLLLLPLVPVMVMNLRLAARLTPLLAQAERGAIPAADAARQAARLMRQHRIAVSLLSFLAIAVASVFGARWLVLHPLGI